VEILAVRASRQVILPRAAQKLPVSLHTHSSVCMDSMLGCSSVSLGVCPCLELVDTCAQAFARWRKEHAVTAHAVREALRGGPPQEAHLRTLADEARSQLWGFFQVRQRLWVPCLWEHLMLSACASSI
jgi:hypothetical protein